MHGFRFNSPPGWPTPPQGWVPPEGWVPDPVWPPAPPGWAFWLPDDALASLGPVHESEIPATAPTVSAAAVEVTTPPTLKSVPDQPPPPPPPSPVPNEPVGIGPIEAVGQPPDGQDGRIRDLEAEVDALRRQLDDANRRTGEQRPAVEDDFVELDDARLLQQVGIYEYHHPLENAELYRERLTELREHVKDAVKSGKAIEASDKFSYNNSLALGRRMTADFSKLMLRAYNAEADNCVRSLRAGALAAATKRLETAANTIARLGKMMEMRVSPDYHALRITELELTADYLFKQQEEREAAREERERLREERKAEQELAQQREKLDKERAHYANTLEALRAQGAMKEVEDIENRLRDIDAAIEMNDFRVANIRAGYVYVISNIGAFGNSVVKIGMTRRLEPMDRIRELGDASVPFPFDVHALYFSDDAVTLENELHNSFGARRLNHANPRREFFFATPEEVRDVLAAKVGNLLEYASRPAAEQYYQSLSSWPEGFEHELGP